MNTKIIVIIAAFGVVAAGIAFGVRDATPPLAVNDSGAEYADDYSALAPQTNIEGNVEVTVTPLFDEQLSSLQFEIELETHSVELDVDLVQSSVLNDEQGNVYQPFQWDGDLPGGHHRSGVLDFGMLGKKVQTLKLVISGIGDTPPRQFLWTISGIIK